MADAATSPARLTGAARCTVVIPARNAADTIAETIASVRAQTVTPWRLVVVDDGSTDTTAEIVRHLSAEDPRVELIPGPARGTGAARNVGVHAATTPFVSFLDADDLLAPSFLAQMTAPLEADAAIGATYTGWLRLAPDGSCEEGPCPEVDGDLFDRFAAACVFPPHACVVRRVLVGDVGGFEESPTTTEDWDLWQRIARTGARFARVPGSLAIYRMRMGSRSRDSRRVLHDGLAVIVRGHAPDPRVPHPDPAHRHGADHARLGRASYNHLSWAAGTALASGEDVEPLLDAVSGMAAPDLDPWEIAGTLLEAVRITRCAPPSAAQSVVAPLADGVISFLRALERASGTRDIALRATHAIDHLTSQQSAAPFPRTLVTTHETALDLARPLLDIVGFPGRVDRFRADLTYHGEAIGRIELPVCDGRVGALFVADAAADAFGWRLLELFLDRTVFPTLDVERTGDRLVVRREGHIVGTATRSGEGGEPHLFATAGWMTFVQELFGIEDRPLADSDELHAPLVEYEVSQEPRDLRISGSSLVLRCTVGGAFLGDIEVNPDQGILRGGTLRHIVAEVHPEELVRLVAREAIVGRRADDGEPLRRRLAERHRSLAAREHLGLPGGGVALLRHAGAPAGGPAARPVLLPTASRGAIERLAAVTGTPTVLVPPGPATSATAGAAYLPDAFRAAATQPLHSAALHYPIRTRPPAATDGDGTLVLCYTRVAADDRSEQSARDSAPDNFEAHIAFLQSAGYHPLSGDEWNAAVATGEPPSGRRVLVTFDGGYRDFANRAWPALRRHGFGALVFLVTGAIGDASEPTAAAVERGAPRLDWATIRLLHAEGVAFGSNSVRHPWLTGQTVDGIVAELFESRAIIEETLGDRVVWFAYPYGAEDGAIRRLVGAAGYSFAVSRRAGRWRSRYDALSVPRVLVHGRMSLDDFARACATH